MRHKHGEVKCLLLQLHQLYSEFSTQTEFSAQTELNWTGCFTCVAVHGLAKADAEQSKRREGKPSGCHGEHSLPSILLPPVDCKTS